ncbi:hypothetical protein Ocin01_08903 [Orchesella cincta]|uniref:Uncharacterized protein n=1 Tax=Orchesella cincta TaxID=48709 RepID=A0A1D2MXP3_ORCCI|nr:hypothetical protein Ocin01_08903 [Orchesella cincta]
MELPLMFRIKGTVILTIWWQLILIIIYTAGLVCISNYVEGWEIKFPQTLIPVLGVVTGLLLVFRTNTAYDRYWEGRKLWSTMTLNIRTLARCIWVMVAEKENTSSEIIEKASAINLLVAFAYATKNYLREEYSYDEEDLYELINHIPKFSTPSSNQPLEDQEEDKLSAKSKVNPKSVSGSRGNLDNMSRPRISSTSSSKKRASQAKTYNLKAYEKSVPTNIPIELSYYIASYINSVRVRELADGSTIAVMNTALNSLVDCLGGFERILRTPIPLAYSVHLHHATWLYLLALPYQLIGTLNWFTIPAVALAAFALLGILGIGWEIENPFGYDDNDLPLDDFCKVIHKEILTIIGHRMPTPESWLLSSENHPLAPESRLTASELITLKDYEIRGMLRKGANLRLSQRNLHYENGSDLKAVTVSIGGAAIKGESEELRSMIRNA